MTWSSPGISPSTRFTLFKERFTRYLGAQCTSQQWRPHGPTSGSHSLRGWPNETRIYSTRYERPRIAVHISPSAVTTRHRAVHLTENVDDREVTQVESAGHFTMTDLPAMEPTLVHLASVTDEDFTVDFIRELRKRRFLLRGGYAGLRPASR